MVLDQLAKWRLYANLPRLKQAFELLESPEAQKWPDGRIQLDRDLIIASTQTYTPRPEGEGKWETHKRYIDIQYVVFGAEKIGYAPDVTLSPSGTFDVAKDIGFYSGTGDFITLSKGMFAIFYPHDAHMPGLQVSKQAEQVRKIVVKVAMES